jgi:hypothetical protein
MFRAIGLVIIIYGLSIMLSDAFVAFELAAVATFNTLETAAVVSKETIEEQRL